LVDFSSDVNEEWRIRDLYPYKYHTENPVAPSNQNITVIKTNSIDRDMKSFGLEVCIHLFYMTIPV
jgi:hypothetical protein